MQEGRVYRRCMVLAGGGSRLGVYLGMYAALLEQDAVPDLLLATCGGAMAAAIIQCLPQPRDQLDWLASPAMHRWWSSAQPTHHATPVRVLWGLVRRGLAPWPAPRVVDFATEHLYHFPTPDFLPPSVGPGCAAGLDVAIIGARWLAAPETRGRPRHGRPLLQQVLFGPPALRSALQDLSAPCGASAWPGSAVLDALDFVHDASLATAASLSMRDAYYFDPLHWRGHDYMGGMVDLFPIEIARRLASEVVMEFKSPFNRFTAAPGWRAALGISAHQRLRQVHAQRPDVRIDCSDIRRALPERLYSIRWDGFGRPLQVRAASESAHYRRVVQAQWDFGYVRASEALANARQGLTVPARLRTRLNTDTEGLA
jgi:predicted acylesterase/phospholipase RssA